ncbi:MAG: serine/threonine protein kinase [Lachnospiraceae bacterium]|nr:serine/threonine protein kinase [Lachnospiraceae bacterium]
MLKIGSVIDGKYKILNQIGKGGMSIVYLAMNERANKQWAVKEVRKDGVQDFEIVRQGLIVEMEMLKRLRHPYLPTIIDVIDTEDSFLIVMDYIEGKPLSRALAEHGALPQEYVIEWAKQLCEVLGYLHTRKNPIIYRDLKPDNIMLRPDGSITLIDFGIAREYKEYAAHDTRALGTQGYAAPEQFGGQGQTDARTDIYGLGTTLYHLVTGYNPSEPPYEIFPIRHWNPSLSQGLERIIWKCIQRNPKDRYQSCAEILYALEHYQDLDNKHSLKLKLKLASFLTMTVLTAALSLTSFWAYYAKTSMVTQSYDAYIEDGRSGATAEEQFDYYEKAIQLMPGEEQAYLDMIDRLYLGDDILTADEDQQIRTLLIRKTGTGKTYEETLKENTQGYEQLAYRLGIAYFYSYEDQGNKAMSTKWLTIAANASGLDENQTQRAAKLGKIAEYYAKLGVESKSGDDNISYADYWADLCQVTEGNITQMDNATTALMVYREMVNQVYVNGMKFKKAGVAKAELQGQLDNVRERLKTDIGAEMSGNERVQALADEVQGTLEQAQRVLDDYEIWNGEGQ